MKIGDGRTKDPKTISLKVVLVQDNDVRSAAAVFANF
jgi:hypothetical protein